jgi:chromosome segregation ATPase
VIQMSFGDLGVCLVAEGVGEWNENTNERPSQWLDRASRVVMETRRGGTVQQLEIVPAGGGRRTTWRSAGAERPVDQAAQQWRAQLLAVLDTTWELNMLRGQVSSLRGDVSSLEGERSSLRGEISSLYGEVSSMRGHASSILGEESSLRGEISSIRGEVSSLRGAISSERGAISSLNASHYRDRVDRDRVDALIASHEKEIERLEQEIRDFNEDARVAAVEKQIDELNAAKKVAQIEAEIKAFDVERKIAAIEREITKLDVEGRATAIEQKIRGLDADRRGRQLEDRRATELKRLDAAISAIR